MPAIRARARASFALILGLFPAPGLLSEAPASHGLEIRLASGTEHEIAAREQLLRLLAEHPVPEWIFTREIVIESGVVPHSHPVLTLNTRHLDDDDAALATFLHEQLHWPVADALRRDEAAVGELRRLFPEVPVGRPDGGRDEFSTYLHLIVCRLEYLALADLLGPEAAARTAAATDHYRWIYRQVLDRGPELDRVMAANGIVLPPRASGHD